MTLDECLEQYRTARRPHWGEGQTVLVCSRMLLAFGDWKPQEDIDATDYEKGCDIYTASAHHNLRHIGEWMSKSEVEREQAKYEAQAPIREKIRELGQMFHDRMKD